MPHGQFHGSLLEIEKLLVERGREMILRNALPRLAAKVIHDLQIHLVRRRSVHRRPTLVQNLDQILGNVDGEVVVPPLSKPPSVFLVVVVVAELGIQFAVACHPAECKVARPHYGHDRVRRVFRAVRKVELRVKRMPQVEFYAYFAVRKLPAKSPQSLFIGGGRNAESQLSAEIGCDFPAPSLRSLGIDMPLLDRIHFLDHLGLRTVHSDKQPAHAMDRRRHAPRILFHHITARERLDFRCNLTPAPQIEISCAKIGALHTDV